MTIANSIEVAATFVLSLFFAGCVSPQATKSENSSPSCLATLETILVEEGASSPIRVLISDDDYSERHLFSLPRWCFQLPPRNKKAIDYSEYFQWLLENGIEMKMHIPDFVDGIPKVIVPCSSTLLSNYELVLGFLKETSNLTSEPVALSISTNAVAFWGLKEYKSQWFRNLGGLDEKDVTSDVFAITTSPPCCLTRDGIAILPAVIAWNGKIMEIEPGVFSRTLDSIVGETPFDATNANQQNWFNMDGGWIDCFPETYRHEWFRNVKDWDGYINQMILLFRFSSVKRLANSSYSIIRNGSISIESIFNEGNDWVWFSRMEPRRRMISFPKDFNYSAFW